MIQKLAEHSNIKTIFFVENEPNPIKAYPGCWWVLSFDGNGEQVESDEGSVGNAYFTWQEKSQAEQYLKDLKEICPEARTEYFFPNQESMVLVGSLDKRMN